MNFSYKKWPAPTNFKFHLSNLQSIFLLILVAAIL